MKLEILLLVSRGEEREERGLAVWRSIGGSHLKEREVLADLFAVHGALEADALNRVAVGMELAHGLADRLKELVEADLGAALGPHGDVQRHQEPRHARLQAIPRAVPVAQAPACDPTKHKHRHKQKEKGEGWQW